MASAVRQPIAPPASIANRNYFRAQVEPSEEDDAEANTKEGSVIGVRKLGIRLLDQV